MSRLEISYHWAKEKWLPFGSLYSGLHARLLANLPASKRGEVEVLGEAHERLERLRVKIVLIIAVTHIKKACASLGTFSGVPPAHAHYK